MTDRTHDIKPSLLGLTLDGLKAVCAEMGLPSFAAGQLARRLYVNRSVSFDEMTELPKKARVKLAGKYSVGRYGPASESVSVDGTRKYLFDVGLSTREADGYVESVYIPDRDRATLCVSCQAGCKMACSFCMTGRLGFHGNLSTGDIINQVLSIPGADTLTNIVFMGMGEPCDNLEAVIDAIGILTAPWGLAWSPKRITVSSVGKLPEMRILVEKTKVHIAYSLHSPYSHERQSLMPVEKVWPASEVIDMLRRYDFAHQRRLSVEYIMFRGLNDDPRHAEALARSLKGTSARVNLIRYHAGEGDRLAPPSATVMEQFRDRLNALGVTATIRTSRGEDILAACGMLAAKNKQPNTI